MNRQQKEALDRWITREPPEERRARHKLWDLPSGSKPAKKGDKCSYCGKPAVEYVFSPSYCLLLCEKHGGRKDE